VSLAIERRRELMGRLLAAAEDPLLRAPSGQVLGAVRKLGLEGASSSLPPLARYFSARRPEKARLIHPARIFRVSSTNNVMPKAKSARKPNAALMKPVQPDDTLAKIVGSTPLPRSEVTKKIWDYIKKNKLQDAKKKTLINADDALKAVFGGKKKVTMFEMTKHVSGHVK
jgi:upstream activation factor subunit UAF30